MSGWDSRNGAGAGGNSVGGRKFYDTGYGSQSKMGSVWTPTVSGQSTPTDPNAPQPGVVSINPLDPAGSAQNAGDPISGLFGGIKNFLLGTSQPDVNGRHGGVLGDIPVAGDALRAGAETIANVGGAVGTAGLTAVGRGADIVGGALEHLPSSGAGAELDQKYNNIAADTVLGYKADGTPLYKADYDKMIAEDKGLAGTGILSAGAHYKAAAVAAAQKEQENRGLEHPTLLGADRVAPASLADEVTNFFSDLNLLQVAAQRTAAGMQNIQGKDRLQQAIDLSSGQYASTGFLGLGILAGSQEATPAEKLAAAKFNAHEWTRDEALDFLVTHAAGWGHDPAQQVFGSIAGDPTVALSFGAAGVARLGMKGVEVARVLAEASKGVEEANSLLKAAQETAAAAKGARAIKAAQKGVTAAEEAVSTATEKANSLAQYHAVSTPRGINLPARAIEGRKGIQDTLALAGKVYSGLEGTNLGRVAKITRTIIDPFHALDLHMPGAARAVDLTSDVFGKNLAETMGRGNYSRILNTLSGLDDGGVALEQFAKDMSAKSANHARELLMNNFRGSQMFGNLGDSLLEKLPDDLVEQAAKSMKERDLLRLHREDIVKNVYKQHWSEGDLTELADQMKGIYHAEPKQGWAEYINKASNEERSLMKEAVYGNQDGALIRAKEQSRIAEMLTAGSGKRTIDDVVLIAKSTLTRQGAEGLSNRLGALKTAKAKARVIAEYQAKYPELGYISIDDANVGKSVREFEEFLSRHIDRTPMTLTHDEIGDMHDSFQSLSGSLGNGYSLGFKPEDRFLWGLERSNKAGGKYFASGPAWVGHVAYEGAGYRGTRLATMNLVGNPVVDMPIKAAGKVVDNITNIASTMKMQVSGSMIAEAAHQKFLAIAADSKYAPHGLTQQTAQKWWERIQEYTREHQGYSGPRGFAKGDLYGDLYKQKLIPHTLLNGSMQLNEDDVLRMMLEAYDGDMRYIGLTQKLSGRAKAYLYNKTGSNFAGQVAEHLWPTMKFRFNPVFQLQEKIEPWVLNAMRGIAPAFTTHLNAADAATERLLTRLTENSIVRVADLDQAEYSAMVLLGRKLGVVADDAEGVLGGIKAMSAQIRDVQGVKRLNAIRTFRKGLGKELKASWDEVMPGAYDDIKAAADVNAGRILDHDEFALNYLGEQMFSNDVKVAKNGIGGDFRNAINTDVWYTPTHMGEVRDLGLDHVAEALRLPDKQGNEITDLAGLRKALANKSVNLDAVSEGLRRLNAHPDYIMRVENALTFHGETFWKNVAKTFSLTPEETASLQDMVAGAAALRGATPDAFLSQFFAPDIINGMEGKVGALSGSVDLMKEFRSKLAGVAGKSTREDLIKQMASVFGTYLDPSAKRALLMEFKPELKKAIGKGHGLDMRELTAMWDSEATNSLADRIIRYMDGVPGTAASEVLDEARGVKTVRYVADKYLMDRGVTPLADRPHYVLDADMQAHYDRVAQEYAGLTEVPYDKTGRAPNFRQVNKADIELKPKPAGVDDATYEAYQAFVQDTAAQWDMMTKPSRKGGLGLKVTFTKSDPYPDSAAMRADLAKGRLKVYAGESDHPLMTNEQNVMFRAVHDVFGHGAQGFEFGPRGELNAAAMHARMYSEDARGALLTETHGQTAYNNFSNDVIPAPAAPKPIDPASPIPDYVQRFPQPFPESNNIQGFGGGALDAEGEFNTEFHLPISGAVGEGLSEATPEAQQQVLQQFADLQAMHPDYPLQHLDIHYGFTDSVEEGGFGMDRATQGVTFGGENTDPVIILNPSYFEDPAASLPGMVKRWEDSKGMDSFGGTPRITAPGTPYNFMPDHAHVMRHEYGHVVLGRIRFGPGARTLPENKLVNDFLDEFLASGKTKYLSEYSARSLRDFDEGEILSDLYSAATAPEADLIKYGVHPDIIEAGKELKQRLIASGHMVDQTASPFAGKTVREVNAAKRGSYYGPQRVGLLPQSTRDEFFQRYVGQGKHVESNPDVARAARMFGKWTDNVVANGLMRGERSVHGGILNDIAGIPTAGAVPYNATEAEVMHLMANKMADKWRDAYRLQYFAQERSWFERSLNHPMFGLYPASYMWGKIGPEVAAFLATRPFGLQTGAVLRSGMDVQAMIALRREFDPEFDAKIESLGHSQALGFLGYLLPTLPWDINASAPVWAKDIAAQGLRNEKAVAAGKPIPHGADFAGGADVLQPTLDTLNKLNPLETSLPWGAKGVGELQNNLPNLNPPKPGQTLDAAQQKQVEASKPPTGPVKGTQLAPELTDIMAELQRVLSRQ